MNEETFLPIGSVVTLDGFKEKIIVAGYGLFKNNITYKYFGFAYPVCYTPNTECVGFNYSRIKEIIFLGYKNDKYEKLSKIVNRVIEKKKE